MKKGIIAKKIGMTQIFDENGKVIPVTVLEAGPCVVVQKKTVENDGYAALQLGFGDASVKKTNKPMQGHFKKADCGNKKYLREFKLDDSDNYNVGDIIKVDVFGKGDIVDVIGTSKGKGYQGVIKRYNAHRLKMTHGTGPVHRHSGSNGPNTNSRHSPKGAIKPGHMGVERVTVQNLTVVKIDVENNLIAIKGAVPGAKGGVVCIKNAAKKA